jgi:hypothetical protein
MGKRTEITRLQRVYQPPGVAGATFQATGRRDGKMYEFQFCMLPDMDDGTLGPGLLGRARCLAENLLGHQPTRRYWRSMRGG